MCVNGTVIVIMITEAQITNQSSCVIVDRLHLMIKMETGRKGQKRKNQENKAFIDITHHHIPGIATPLVVVG